MLVKQYCVQWHLSCVCLCKNWPMLIGNQCKLVRWALEVITFWWHFMLFFWPRELKLMTTCMVCARQFYVSLFYTSVYSTFNCKDVINQCWWWNWFCYLCQGGYILPSICLSVCFFCPSVCQQLLIKTSGWIFVKILPEIHLWTGENWSYLEVIHIWIQEFF